MPSAHYFEDYHSPHINDLAKRFSILGIEAILLTISEDMMEKRIRQRVNQINY